MKVRVSIPIEAAKEDIWRVMTDFEHENETLHAVNNVEIIENPNNTLNGLKWKETRTMFGKEESEVMSITEFKENSYFKSHAENHGMAYDTTYAIEPEGDHNLLLVNFEAKPQKFTSRLTNMLFGSLMKTTTERSLLEDMQDIKEAVEHH